MATDPTQPGFFSLIARLADRPECLHGLNGPCSECGPPLPVDTLDDWQAELLDLGVTPQP